MFGLTTLAAHQLPLGNMLFIIISFLVLMVILKKVAYGPLTKVLDERAAKISSDIDSAEKARQEAEKLAAQRQSELADTRQQATKVVADAKAGAKVSGFVRFGLGEGVEKEESNFAEEVMCQTKG